MDETEHNVSAETQTPQQRQGGKWRLVGLVLAVLLFIGLSLTLPIRDYIHSLLQWVQDIGMWGPVVVILFYIVSCLAFLPGFIVTLGAGFLFELILGTITVSIGSTLGACAAFLVGRTVARDWIAEKVAGNAKFRAIDDAVGREGFKIVLLIRLSPIFPFNLINYAFGLTRVSFWRYAVASWIGMIPGTIMYVYIGSGLRSLAEVAAGEVERGPAQRLFFWVGLAVTVAVAVFVTRLARRALQDAVRDAAAEEV